MPGTIYISVLEVRNLPSSSSSDTVSIRVAMGKREYRIVDGGDFSIPLTTLRENMLVKVFDANGVEISRTGIDTKRVVEKGSWNDSFPLEGGGEMLLKLQFVLSEEEQNRIRVMRLSALKKKEKDGEIVNKSLIMPDKAPFPSLSDSALKKKNDGEIVDKSPILPQKAPFPSLGDEKGSEQKKAELMIQRVLSQDEAATTSSPRHAFPVKSRNSEAALLNQDITVGRSDGGEDPPRLSPLSSDVTAPLSETGLKNLAKTSSLEVTSPSAPHKPKGGAWDVQRPPKKTQSSIRTMISVFESGRVPESRIESKTFGGNNKMASTKSSEDSSVSREIPEQVASQTQGAVSDPLREESQLLSRGEIEERVGPSSVRVNPDSSPSSAEIVMSHHSDDSDLHRDQNRVQIWDSFCHDEEMSGIWIFPDDPRSICITTGGKRAIRLMECCVETIAATMTEHPGKGAVLRMTEHGAKERERATHGVHPSSSAGGPSGQVMRIAVMVGFGALVLFARRRQDGSGYLYPIRLTFSASYRSDVGRHRAAGNRTADDRTSGGQHAGRTKLRGRF